MDLLAPEVGEICGGSLREERLEPLQQALDRTGFSESLSWLVLVFCYRSNICCTCSSICSSCCSRYLVVVVVIVVVIVVVAVVVVVLVLVVVLIIGGDSRTAGAARAAP